MSQLETSMSHLPGRHLLRINLLISGGNPGTRGLDPSSPYGLDAAGIMAVPDLLRKQVNQTARKSSLWSYKILDDGQLFRLQRYQLLGV
jgi:hypothetical protein